MKTWIVFSGMLLSTLANAAGEPSIFRKTEVRVWEERDPNVTKLTVGIGGAAAKAIFDSMLMKEVPHRGLFLKWSQDHTMDCQRSVNPIEYYCELELAR